MIWDDTKRAHYFGCECSPGLADVDRRNARCLNELEADGGFLERYCAPTTITGLNGVPTAVARCVIAQLTRLVPNADHASPSWNWRKDLRPAVVIGKLRAGSRIQNPRCGLWAHDGHLYFWADQNVFGLLGLQPTGWEPYGPPMSGGGGPRMLRYTEPLACHCDPPEAVRLPEAVTNFLERFARLIEPSDWPEGPFVPQQVHTQENEPGSRVVAHRLEPRPHGQSSADNANSRSVDKEALPSADTGKRVTRQAKVATLRRGDGDARQIKPASNDVASQQSDGGVVGTDRSNDRRSRKLSEIAYDFIGIVFENRRGELGNYVAPRAEFQQQWLARIENVTNRVIFLCCGPDFNGVTAIINQIQQVKAHLTGGYVPNPPHGVGQPQGGVGDTYCYGCFDPAQPPAQQGRWGNPFYIGVGSIGQGDGLFEGRWTKHVQDALRGENQPRHHRIRTWLAANPPPARMRPREHAARSGLVRKLYAFNGPHRKHLRFFVEMFLISHAFGTHNLDNDTEGNNRSETYFGITRPKIFDAETRQHVYCWEQLLAACVQDPKQPCVGDVLVPGLLSLVAASFVPQLNTALVAIGLQPLDNVPEGRLAPEAIIHNNLNVSGANDCMLSYAAPGRVYRIDLRFSKKRPSIMINMRPAHQGGAARNQFRDYILQHQFQARPLHGVNIAVGSLLNHYGAIRAINRRSRDLPVMNSNSWPFYKPMAYNAEGNKAEWFPISWPVGAAITFPSISIIQPNWLTGAGQPANLNLIQALELVLAAFP